MSGTELDLNEQDNQKVPKGKKKSKTRLLPIVLVLGVAAYVGYTMFQTHLDSQNKKQAAIAAKKKAGEQKEDQEKQKVRVFKSSRQNFIHQMQTLGTILAKNKVTLRFEVNGVVETLNVREGEEVIEGDTIAELAHRDAELKVAFRASKLKEAQFELGNWEAKLQSSKKLLEAGAINKTSFKETEASYYRSLQAVKSAKIELQSAQSELEKTNLICPIDGIVGKVEIPQGEYVTPQNKVMSIYEISEVYVEFSVLEQNIQQVSIGQKVQLTVDTYPDEIFKGKIESLGTVVETTEGRVRKVKAIVGNKNKQLIPGMFAHVEIILFQKENEIVIPHTAFLDVSQDITSVWVIDKSNTAKKREVSVEHLNIDQALIEKGLNEGDLVVVDVATVQLKEGLEVEVVEVLEAEKSKKDK